MNKPNILILMPDQLRADAMGCAGHPVIKTPNMDRLAAEGMRFRQAVTVCPVCMPARASFVNGLYPHNHGMWTNKGEMPADDETFFQILQKAGYFTAHIGKSHYFEHRGGHHLREREPYMHARGLEYVHEVTGPLATRHTASYLTDEWDKKGLWEVFKKDYAERSAMRGGMVRPSPLAVEDHPDSYVGRKTVEFVETLKDPRPLCLFVGFPGPHEPWDAPGEYASMYAPESFPPAIPGAALPSDAPEWMRGNRDFESKPPEVLAQVPAIRANYGGKITLIDRWIGGILDAFAKRGMLDDLLVVLWSDHGEMAGDHGCLYKSVFYEASVRVPLIVRWPGRMQAGTETDALAEITDIFPTLVEAAGCEASRRCLGRSLWPVLREPEHPLREYQLSEIAYGYRHIMIRSRRHKYVVDEKARGYMLYDLEKDPMEQNNLILGGGGDALERDLREKLLARLVEAQYRM